MNKYEIDLILHWFAHIEQLATDRKTLTSEIMSDNHTLDEICCLAERCQKFIKSHCLQEAKTKQFRFECEQRINDSDKLLNSIFNYENI